MTPGVPGVEPFVAPPRRPPFPWGWILNRVEKHLGRRLEANRILAWSPRLLAGTGLMEALVVHDDPEVPRRLLKLLRLAVSYGVSCPFCIDLNAHGHAGDGVTDDEVRALALPGAFETCPSLSDTEKAVLRFAACLTATPVRFPDTVVADLKSRLSDRGFTVVAATAAQVNLWARLIQGLGVQEAGFSSDLNLLDLDRFRTRVP